MLGLPPGMTTGVSYVMHCRANVVARGSTCPILVQGLVALMLGISPLPILCMPVSWVAFLPAAEGGTTDVVSNPRMSVHD